MLDEDQADSARPLLLEAAKDKADWLVQYHVATGLTRIATTTDDRDPASSRRLGPRSSASRPRVRISPTPMALGARLDAAEDTDIDPRALQTIRRARAISPGRRGLHPDRVVHPAAARRIRRLRASFLSPLTGPTHSAQCPRERAVGHRTGGETRARGGGLSSRGSRGEGRPRAPAAGRAYSCRSTGRSNPASIASRGSSNASTAGRRASSCT